jgi:hypothetical protein
MAARLRPTKGREVLRKLKKAGLKSYESKEAPITSSILRQGD